MDRYLYTLEIIKKELGNFGFKHRYYEKENSLVLITDTEVNVTELGSKLKDSGLVMKVLK